MHEVTAFKWDRAYFFLSSNTYNNQNIIKFSGITENLNRDDTLVVFMNKGRLVKYSFFDSLDFFDDSFKGDPPKNIYFNIAFHIDKEILKKIDYSGSINDFGGHTKVDYYELSPQNDLLYISRFSQSRAFQGYWHICSATFTNPTQVHVLNVSK